MTSLLPIADLDTFASTRDALHRVAEHVVAKARFLDDREIRLTAYPGGFASPLLAGETRVRVEADELVIDSPSGSRRTGLTTIAEAHPSQLILWPEHFDQAFYTEDADETRRANYGASPGDEGHPEPYLYVGPWGPTSPNAYWNAEHFNGAVLGLSELLTADDAADTALQFLRAGRVLLAPGTTR